MGLEKSSLKGKVMATPAQEQAALQLTEKPIHANLTEALAAAQAEFPDIPKNRTAKVKGRSKAGTDYEYEYQYADFADVLKAVRPVLARHGLAFSQPIRRKELKLHLTSILRFGSEVLESDGLPIPEIMEPQQMGSLLTYWRRYDGCSLLGIQPDEDDDARRASLDSGKRSSDRTRQEVKMDRQADDIKRISAKDIRAFYAACNSSGKKPTEIKMWLRDQRLTSLEELPAELAEKAIRWAASEGTNVPKDLVAVMGQSAELATREKANKRVWALAAEYSIPQEDVKKAAYEIYGVESMTELTAAQLSEHAEWIKAVAEQAAEAK